MTENITAQAILDVIPDSRWIGTSLAKARLHLRDGGTDESAARLLYDADAFTLRKSKEIVQRLRNEPFTNLLEKRTKTGSSENPVTKLFPAAITERQFLDKLDKLRECRSSIDYSDQRLAGHTLVDFTLIEGDSSLPINVKNAGTRFENALQLVGLDAEDCIPIPAYKAYDAVEKEPSLLYAVSIDYGLISTIEKQLLPLFSNEESIVWGLLNNHTGKHVRNAEDAFIYSLVQKYWATFSKYLDSREFRLISARKSIRILQQQPKRTPGLGLRAWGNGASAEVNVHISVAAETKAWQELHDRICKFGLTNIIQAVNRKRTEVVYDPEL